MTPLTTTTTNCGKRAIPRHDRSFYLAKCLTVNGADAANPADFWEATSTFVLIGLLNGAVLRSRFPVEDFTATSEGKQAAPVDRFQVDNHEVRRAWGKRADQR